MTFNWVQSVNKKDGETQPEPTQAAEAPIEETPVEETTEPTAAEEDARIANARAIVETSDENSKKRLNPPLSQRSQKRS